MHLPIEDLTPRQIVEALDQYIVGQAAAKKAVAVALRNRFRRQRLSESERDDVLPKNILMMGPTGVGKTEIARRLAQLARAPFIKIEATKFTEVGYVGRDVESMVRDLVAIAVRLVEREKLEAVRDEVDERVMERLIDLLEDAPPQFAMFGDLVQRVQAVSDGEDYEEVDWEAREAERQERRKQIRHGITNGDFDRHEVEVAVEESTSPFVQVFSNQGMEEMGIDGPFGNMGTRTAYRRMEVAEAKGVLFEEESKKVLDRTATYKEAIYRTEQTGIIFIDEIDKVAAKSGGSGPDVSREGVQRDLLPIIEGSTVATKFGAVRTDHILFVAAGAFHISKVSDLIPELQGRLPIRVRLDALSEGDFRRILREPKNALTRQYQLLLATEGVQISFDDAALDEIAHVAVAINEKTENIGARRLHTVMEKLLEDVMFEAPDIAQKQIHFTVPMVKEKLDPLLADGDYSRYIV
ncbi:MAG TPA: ATP-dependent protease ATPase subunit HslU [Fimbriimonadaceae bacterium]|nr:ATP-dependent protease ATPase subunit HslU [Fimbriimonadaceae bacterium]